MKKIFNTFGRKIESWDAQMPNPTFRMKAALVLATIVGLGCLCFPEGTSTRKLIGGLDVMLPSICLAILGRTSNKESFAGSILRSIGLVFFLSSIKSAFIPPSDSDIGGHMYLMGIAGLGIFLLTPARFLDEDGPWSFFGINLKKRIGFGRRRNL